MITKNIFSCFWFLNLYSAPFSIQKHLLPMHLRRYWRPKMSLKGKIQHIVFSQNNISLICIFIFLFFQFVYELLTHQIYKSNSLLFIQKFKLQIALISKWCMNQSLRSVSHNVKNPKPFFRLCSKIPEPHIRLNKLNTRQRMLLCLFHVPLVSRKSNKMHDKIFQNPRNVIFHRKTNLLPGKKWTS